MNTADAPAPTTNSEPLYTADGYTIEESVGYLIAAARSRLINALDDEVDDLGLTGAQLSVLLRISATHECTAAALCRGAVCDTGSMTRMIDRLEEKGFIRRTRNQTDRRVVNLEMTAAGRALLPMITPRIVNVLNRHLKGFSRGELETLKSMLRRILANA